jgi:hypothetical protein
LISGWIWARSGEWRRGWGRRKAPKGGHPELPRDVLDFAEGRQWAPWREGGKTRNVHLGSSRKMDAEAARQKARERKAEALGI